MTEQTTPPSLKRTNRLKDIILLFAVPIGVVAISALAINIPKLLANPNTDFIYATCANYSCDNDYQVNSSGRISEPSLFAEDRSYRIRPNPVEIRYYSAETDSTKPISLEEAQAYRLDPSSKSPDGYSLVREESGSSFLFFSGDYGSSWYLKDGIKRKEINLSANNSYYADVTLLGWVIQ